ncbi:MAG: hypothetical protein Q4B90_01100 [Eubacteriales bacterium]|nr:hypothetical protein [Eubacteriales bacterium]
MAYYKIADCITSYTPIYPLLEKQMAAYRIETSKKPDITLSITRAFCEQKQRENPHLTAEQCEYIFAGSEFYKKLILHGGFFLHASAVEVDQRAYLFSARSGTGKSTHTKLWQKYFGADRALIINDDKPAIKIEDHRCMVYGTPFSGKTDENLNRCAPLQGICMIERGKENKIWRIEVGEAIPLLFQQTLLPKNQSVIDKLFSMIDTVLRQVPIYRMQCTISEEAAMLAYETMRGEEQ